MSFFIQLANAETWVTISNTQYAVDVMQYLNNQTEKKLGSWSSMQLLKLEKNTDTNNVKYRAKIRIGKEGGSKCTKYGATCNPDTIFYKCNDIEVEKVNENFNVLSWKVDPC